MLNAATATLVGPTGEGLLRSRDRTLTVRKGGGGFSVAPGARMSRLLLPGWLALRSTRKATTPPATAAKLLLVLKMLTFEVGAMIFPLTCMELLLLPPVMRLVPGESGR